MWLNQQTIDAIRLMAELAARWPQATKAADLAVATGITPMNVQKTVHALARASLIETERGRHGGVRLVRAVDAISVGEIVRAFEPKDCPANFLVASDRDAAISDLLFKAHREFFHPLENATLADLEKPLRRQRVELAAAALARSRSLPA
ncbi:MAG: Rrf2 family transcriptional regulator [Beijerinckiaceae bacterium]